MSNREKKKKIGNTVLRELWEYIKMIIIVVLVVYVVNNVLLINAQIPSESMEKTIMTGDRIFGNRLAYLNSKPERFDVVIFRYPDNEEQLFIKRVIGLPGETLNIIDGKVYVDGSDTPLDDSFIPEAAVGSYGPYEVPEGCYFMLGDNRNYSKDSRFWINTYVKEDQILGKAVLRYFPSVKIIE
ncbi:MAG: signal peptidase I [Lachnospiraceae bacterium]|jgi:signal peptidase I